MSLTTKSRNAIIKGVITRKSPIYVQFAVSKGCNLKCRMCNAVESRKNEQQLNLEQIEHLSEVLDKLGVGVLILTGGEPTLRPDIVDIIKIFSKKGFDLKLQTNGFNADESQIKDMIAAGIKDVTISLDTLDEAKQDYINGVKGSWDRAIRSLALYSEHLPRKGNMSIINTVVSKLNYMDVPDVINFVDAIGFYSSLIPVHLSDNNDYIVRKDSDEFKFDDPSIIDDVYKAIIRMKKEGFSVHNSYSFLKACPTFLKSGEVHWKCDSPYLYFSISPNGTFLPCVDKQGYKSMFDDDFLKDFRTFQDALRPQVQSCNGCMYACYPEVSGFVKNPFTLAERALQGLKIENKERKVYTFKEMMDIIRRIRK
jgi:cyclic pyranopterin phosphate synthase